MKKTFFIVLALMAVLSTAVFAGARQQAGGTGGNAPGYTGNLPYVEFDWYTPVNNIMPDVQMVNDALNAYIGPKINAKVNMRQLHTSDMRTRMPVMVASGQDLGIIGYGDETTLDYVIHSQRGSFYPIEKLLDQYGTGIKALFNQGVWDTMTINGHIYGIPPLKDNCYIISFIYNEDLANKLGVDMTTIPYTAANFYKLEPWFNEVKAKRDQILGANIEEPLLAQNFANYNSVVDTIFNSSSIAVTNIDGFMDYAGYDSKTFFNAYATQEYRDYAHAMWRMVQKNILAYDYEGKNEWNYTGNMFGWVGHGYTYMPEHLFGDNFTTRMVEPTRAWTSTGNYFSTGVSLSAASRNPDRQMMFMELVNTDPFLATMLRFGVEGTHYKKDAQGRMTFEGTRNAGSLADRGYYHWYYALVGNLTIVQAPEDHIGPNGIMLTKMAQYNRDAVQPTHMGFTFNIQPVSNEVAACANVVAEYGPTLSGGQASSEAEVDRLIDEFNAKLKANGIDRILAEAQRQGDAFLASR
jgi:putative aldouronate transport system substrate-binding protein